MSRFLNKRWGRLMLLFLCVICLSLSVIPFIQKDIKAETIEIDDGPSGEKIVDIEGGAGGWTYYSITENGNVYAWGYNFQGQLGRGTITPISDKPMKVLNAEYETSENLYLSNIKKIYAGGTNSQLKANGMGGKVFAMAEDGTLYAWGDNCYGSLGLPEKKAYSIPTKVELNIDEEIKDIYVGWYATTIITVTGKVYIAGKDGENTGSLGLGDEKKGGIVDTFTRITNDYNGNELPPIKEVQIVSANMFLVSETGDLYACGHGYFAGTNSNTHISSPKLAVTEDGSAVKNVKRIVTSVSGGTAIVEDESGEYYISYRSYDSKKYFTKLIEYPYLNDPNSLFIYNVKEFVSNVNSNLYLGQDYKLYDLINYGSGGFHNSNKTVTPRNYSIGEIPKDYQNAKKIIGGSNIMQSAGITSLLLSNNGGVYVKGVKVTFGDIVVKGVKTNNETYASNEKYNDDIQLQIQLISDSVDDLRYTVKDLSTNQVSEIQSCNGAINIALNENDRIYQMYEFYIEGKEKETKTSFIVDLYKKTPILTDIEDHGTYKQNKTITLSDNGFDGNKVSATISKDGGEPIEYISGSEIADLGSYTLDSVDLYGNTNQYTFTITDLEGPEGVLFTKNNAGELVVGNQITKTNQVIGSLSLQYPDGSTISEIKTITLGEENDEAHFSLVDNHQLKVENTDLSAGTYVLAVSGTDMNGLPFHDTISIVIEKAVQTMDWNDATKEKNIIKQSDQITLGVKDVLANAAVTYGIKGNEPCVTVDSKTGSMNITCIPKSKEVTVQATSSETTSYQEKMIEHTFTFQHEYSDIVVLATSESKAYKGGWAKHDVTFYVSGGLDPDEIEGYEFAVTDGNKPDTTTSWSTMTNDTLELSDNIVNKTYWFRVLPVDDKGSISSGTKVNLDVDTPSIPNLTLDEVNNTKVAHLINLLSFGNWMNKQVKVTMTSSDTTSGIDHYEYIETVKGTESQPKSSAGTVTYGDETELTLKARACDKAGNCSAYTNAENVKIDMKAPSITGVKDQAEYKQYYLPRFVTVTDSGSGLKQATYKKDNTPAGIFTDNKETEIKGEGSYEIYAVDEAGNEVTLTFKIVKLPNIETEIDGSDESREIIDQIIKELEEVKDKIDQNEKDNYEQWIKDAEEKWDSLRKKVVEDDETTSKVEGQGDTTFDPKTELIVEEIPKENVPVLPRNAIKTYDVYLKKGNTVVQPDGSVKVYLPYDEKETPIVYEINDDGTITELTANQENGYVTFVTTTLKKYAISNTAQKENKKDVCVVGPDNKADSSDDVCGEGNGSGVPPVKEDDGSVTVPDGGKVIFPDKEVPAPDGATINPDGSVDFPDGTHFDPDGNKTKDPDQKPDPNPDNGDKPDHNDKVCVAGPDGKLGTSDDVCGDGNGKEEPDKGNDGSVTVPDGGSVVFPDGNEVELPDGGTIKPDGSVELPDGTIINPDGSKKEPNDQKECKLEGTNINIDTDKDNLPDINLDTDGDCKADLNIDINNDNIPNLNIDNNGDGKADINIDTDGDGIADLNIMLNIKKWIPNLNGKVNGFAYDTMSGLEPDLNVDDNGDGKPDRNLDTDGDNIPDVNVDDDWFSKHGMKNPNDHPTVQGNYNKGNSATGGVNTGDSTKWIIWWIALIITTLTMTYCLVMKKHHDQ